MYESIALEAHKRLPTLTVTAINCVTYDDVCAAHNVASYPTIKLFPGAHVFSGAQTKAAILEWVEKIDGDKHTVAANIASGSDGDQHHHENATLNAPTATGTRATGAPDASKRASGAADMLTRGMLAQHALTGAAFAASGVAGAYAVAAAQALAEEDEMPSAGMVLPRKMPSPVPSADVLAAARYSLYHDIGAALSVSPTQANARKRLGALKAWLHVLHRALPHERDGGMQHGPPCLKTGTARCCYASPPTHWSTSQHRRAHLLVAPTGHAQPRVPCTPTRCWRGSLRQSKSWASTVAQ